VKRKKRIQKIYAWKNGMMGKMHPEPHVWNIGIMEVCQAKLGQI